MKQLLTLVAASAALSGAVFAGPAVESKTIAPPVPEVYGTGWYGALQGGVNAYQDLGGGREFSSHGTRITAHAESDVGGFGGIKLGYVFGTGTVRPALEADLFYNGVDASVNASANGRTVNVGARIDSGAFMANSLLRFSFQRFQPYVGFGLGCYVAQGNDGSVKIDGSTKATGLHTNSTDGLAWQIVAGADYYFTPKLSVFIEYKFLNYVDCVLDKTAEQQLIGAGVRFHF